MIEQLNSNDYTGEEETLSYKVQWIVLDYNNLKHNTRRISQTRKQHRVLWWRTASISWSTGEGKATHQYCCSLFFTKSQWMQLGNKSKYGMHILRKERENYLSMVWLWTLMLGKIDGERTRGRQKMRWLDGVTNSVEMNVGKLWERVKDRDAWHAAVHGMAKSQTWLSDWVATTMIVDW